MSLDQTAPADAVLRGDAPEMTRPLAHPEPVTRDAEQRGEHHDITSLIIVLATVFLPPLGAFLLKGCGAEVVIAICLTILGWIPGIAYVLWLWLSAGGYQRKHVADRRVAAAKAKWQARQAERKARRAQEITTPAAPAQSEAAPLLVSSDAPSLPVLGQMTLRPSTAAYAAPDYSMVNAVAAYPTPKSSGSMIQHPAASGPSGATGPSDTAIPPVAVVEQTSVEAAPAPLSEGAVWVESGAETAIKPKVKKGKKPSKESRAGAGGLYMGLFSSNKNKARISKTETTTVSAEPVAADTGASSGAVVEAESTSGR